MFVAEVNLINYVFTHYTAETYTFSPFLFKIAYKSLLCIHIRNGSFAQLTGSPKYNQIRTNIKTSPDFFTVLYSPFTMHFYQN